MTAQFGVTLFQIAFWIYLAAAVCYVAHLISEREVVGRTGMALLCAGLLIHTVSLLVRTAAAGRPPFMNLYEYMLSFTWGVAVVYLVLERLMKNRALGSFAVPLTAVFAFLAYRLPTEVNPTMPALKSAWRVPHISSGVLAYAAFGLAFALAIMYLIRERAEGKDGSFWGSRLPPPKVLDRMTYRVIAFGFMLQTVLLITGCVWAQFAWGRYWGWDPKETWALITWLVFAAYLHTRATMGWRGRRSALLAIVGFVATVFTLLGVSYLMPGLHSYV